MSFKNQLCNKYLGVQWRCIQSKFLSTLSMDIDSMTVTKGPDAHNAHVDVLDVRLAVMRAIKRMKNEARDEPDVTLKSTYDHNRNNKRSTIDS